MKSPLFGMSKKKKLLLFLLVPVLFLSFGVLTWYVVKSSNLGAKDSSASATSTNTVEYKVIGDGKIKGEAIQKLKKGEWGKAIRAIPNSGSEFRGWSRMTESPGRRDVGEGIDKVYYANFQKIGREKDRVEYVIDDRKLGRFADKNPASIIQYLENGEKGMPVEVVPYVQAEFVGWSDGDTNSSRTDYGSGEYRRYVAVFKKKREVKEKISYRAAIVDEGGHEVLITGRAPSPNKRFPSETYIEGENVQYLSDGEKGKEVKAISRSSMFEFLGWDDGIKTESRTDIGGKSPKILKARFKVKKSICTSVEQNWGYTVLGAKGYIEGTRVQFGGGCTYGAPVRAVPSRGYRFKYWEKLEDFVAHSACVGPKGVKTEECPVREVWKEDSSSQSTSPYRWDKTGGKYRAVFEKIEK